MKVSFTALAWVMLLPGVAAQRNRLARRRGATRSCRRPPELPTPVLSWRIAYIADGTTVGTRNPSKVRGVEPNSQVHAQNYSGNKGLGTSHIVYVNIRGKIIRIRDSAWVGQCRIGEHTYIVQSCIWNRQVSDRTTTELEWEAGTTGGPARALRVTDRRCVFHTRSPRKGNSHTLATTISTAKNRRSRVVVDNTIGLIEKFQDRGERKKAFRRTYGLTFEKECFNVCARLTARIMRVRSQYPRSETWTKDVVELWEAKLGAHLYWDFFEDPGSYLNSRRGR